MDSANRQVGLRDDGLKSAIASLCSASGCHSAKAVSFASVVRLQVAPEIVGTSGDRHPNQQQAQPCHGNEPKDESG